jgi:hypothetical protein
MGAEIATPYKNYCGQNRRQYFYHAVHALYKKLAHFGNIGLAYNAQHTGEERRDESSPLAGDCGAAGYKRLRDDSS